MIELHHKSFGQGPALIILHGLFGSLDNWMSMARRLENEFTVYLVDQRNHGKSPHHEEWNYQVMADDLAHFMDREGIRMASLLGHSMGGKTVMQFASMHAERIDKLIVADIAPVRYEPHHTELIDALTRIDFEKHESRQSIGKALASDIPDPSVRQFLMKGLGRNGDKSFKWKFNLDVIAEKYEKVLEGIPVDVPYLRECLFLYGGKSNYVVDSYRSIILEKFPKAIFESIPKAGHWLHAEAPDEFFEKVYAYLKA